MGVSQPEQPGSLPEPACNGHDRAFRGTRIHQSFYSRNDLFPRRLDPEHFGAAEHVDRAGFVGEQRRVAAKRAGRDAVLGGLQCGYQAVAKRTRLRLVRPMEEVEANLRIGLVDRLADAAFERLHRAAGVRAA